MRIYSCKGKESFKYSHSSIILNTGENARYAKTPESKTPDFLLFTIVYFFFFSSSFLFFSSLVLFFLVIYIHSRVISRSVVSGVHFFLAGLHSHENTLHLSRSCCTLRPQFWYIPELCNSGTLQFWYVLELFIRCSNSRTYQNCAIPVRTRIVQLYNSGAHFLPELLLQFWDVSELSVNYFPIACLMTQ